MRRNRFAQGAALVSGAAAALRQGTYLARQGKRLYNYATRSKNSRSKRKAYGPNGIHKERFIKAVALTSSAAGVLDTRFNLLNPTRIQDGASTVEDWAEVSALYEMYRVTGWKLHLNPELNSNDTTKVMKYITYGIDPNDPDTTAATSALDLLVRGGKQFNTHRPLNVKRKVKMPITALNASGNAVVGYRGGWCPVSDLAVNGPTMKIYGASLTASTTYFAGYMEIYIEFKNRVRQ